MDDYRCPNPVIAITVYQPQPTIRYRNEPSTHQIYKQQKRVCQPCQTTLMAATLDTLDIGLPISVICGFECKFSFFLYIIIVHSMLPQTSRVSLVVVHCIASDIFAANQLKQMPRCTIMDRQIMLRKFVQSLCGIVYRLGSRLWHRCGCIDTSTGTDLRC